MYSVATLRDDLLMADLELAGGDSVSSRRQRRSAEERRLIVEETLEAGSSVARVAMKYGVNANQVFKWRRLHEAGGLGTRAESAVQLLPVRVAEEREVARQELVAAPVPSSGAIHIALPGEVRIRLEGSVDPTIVHAVLKSLRS